MGRLPGKRVAASAFCAGLLLISSPALAEAPRWLVWNSPPECPDAEYIESKVSEWLGKPVPDDVDLLARAEVHWAQAQWAVSVELKSQQARGERSIRVDRCSEAADFVAVTITLAIDPGSPKSALVVDAQAGPRPEAPESGPGTEGAAEVAPSDGPAVEAPNGPGPAAQAARRGADTKASSLRAGGQAAILGATGVFPALALGSDAEAVVVWHRLLAGAGLRYFPRQSFSFARSASPVSYELLGGALKVGHRSEVARLLVIPYLSAEVGSIRTRSVRADGRTLKSAQLWGRVETGLELGLRLGAGFEPLLAAGLSLPLGQPSFRLDDATLVHRPGPGVAVLAGLRYFVGER